MEPREGGIGRRARVGVHALGHKLPVPKVAVEVLGEGGRGGQEADPREKPDADDDREEGGARRRGRRGDRAGRAQDPPGSAEIRRVRGAP